MERETGLEPATTCLEGRDSTTELLPQKRAYFTPKTHALSKGGTCFGKNPNTITALAAGYELFAAAEAKSPRTIENVTSSLAHFEKFLIAHGLPDDTTEIDHHHIQAFILYLRQKKRFSTHPFTSPQPGTLSPYTVSCYLRAIRSFWSWLSDEGIIEQNPFVFYSMPASDY